MSDPTLNQDEIDALLADMGDTDLGPGDAGTSAPEPAPAADAGGADIDLDNLGDFGGDAGGGTPSMADDSADDLAGLMDEAPAPAPRAATATKPAAADIASELSSDFSKKNIEVLLDVPLQVVAELGRSEMPIQNILDLGPGSIVELNRMAGEAISILVNGKLVARGEVVVVDENFGVRITNIISPLERLTQLN